MLLLCFARICAASNPLLLWVLNRDLRLDIVGRDGCLTPGKCPYIKKTAILTQCPVQRPLSEYVRSSKESGCKCHVYMSICNHFPSAKHEESAMQRRKATATGQDSECLEHCESANGAKQCAASFCMVLRFLSKSQIYKKGGNSLGYEGLF